MCSSFSSTGLKTGQMPFGGLEIEEEDACECNWTPWPSGHVCFLFFIPCPHVGCRFLLLRSVASLTTRSFCTGGVMRQGRAPDMIEGRL